jgi:Ergosterol biosynthesis ERG4/ERG24 family
VVGVLTKTSGLLHVLLNIFISSLSPQNYVADWIMSLTWAASAGTTTIIPFFYPAFFIAVLVHRVGRDFERSVPNF